ncbi:hypothetical protein [Methanobrevibacter sp.]
MQTVNYRIFLELIGIYLSIVVINSFVKLNITHENQFLKERVGD